MSIQIIQHLLPLGRAFRTTVDKNLRKLFVGLSEGLIVPIREYLDDISMDLYPMTTRETTKWQEQFGIAYPSATPSADIITEWSNQGYQSPSYIQARLQAAGFDLYVHEFWVPGDLPTITVRNPLTYLWPSTVPPVPLDDTLGYPLVNKIFRATKRITATCGNPETTCGGNAHASCGYFNYYGWDLKVYEIPTDASKWPYFLYIGAQTFGDIAVVTPERQQELERLVLKLCPTHLWIGMLVSYNYYITPLIYVDLNTSVP